MGFKHKLSVALLFVLTLFIAPTNESFAQTLPAGYVSQGGLTWMPVSSNSYTYAQATALCAGTINGQTGWRLPAKDELVGLYNSGAMNGQGWTLNFTWSSTPFGSDGYFVVGLNGGVGWDGGTHGFSVTCVRTSSPPIKVSTTGVDAAGLITAPIATVTATITVNAADVGKTGQVFVTAMLPSGSLGVAPQALRSSNTLRSMALATPANSFVLSQLTQSGWQPVNGQLTPYSTGVLSDQLSAITILNNTSTADLGGAQFCVGYGSNVTEMNSTNKMTLIGTVPDSNGGARHLVAS